MMGCDAYGTSIQFYLDKELSTEDQEDFRLHLEGCEACRTELAAEEELSCLLHQTRPLYAAPDSLRERVIRAAAGPVPSAPTYSIASIRSRTFHWPAAIAATILVVVGLLAGRNILLQSRADVYIETAIAAHRGFLSGSLPLEVQSASPSIVTAWFADKVPFTFRLPTPQETMGHEQIYRLTGGRLVNYKGAHAALVAYQMQQQKISLLVASSTSAVVAGGEEVPSGGIVFHYRKQANFNVITWSTHGLTYALVSSLPGTGRQSCMVCHQDMGNGGPFSVQ
jgi:anti-sigma factor (TIGR02949 family)